MAGSDRRELSTQLMAKPGAVTAGRRCRAPGAGRLYPRPADRPARCARCQQPVQQHLQPAPYPALQQIQVLRCLRAGRQRGVFLDPLRQMTDGTQRRLQVVRCDISEIPQVGVGSLQLPPLPILVLFDLAPRADAMITDRISVPFAVWSGLSARPRPGIRWHPAAGQTGLTSLRRTLGSGAAKNANGGSGWGRPRMERVEPVGKQHFNGAAKSSARGKPNICSVRPLTISDPARGVDHHHGVRRRFNVNSRNRSPSR